MQIYSDNKVPNFLNSNEKCPVGQAVITPAFGLDKKNGVKNIIHAVGPREENPKMLRNAYQSICRVADEKNLKSIAFCAISTKIFGYDVKKATPVALAAVRDFIKENVDTNIREIIFVVFDDQDYAVYKQNGRILLGLTPDDLSTEKEQPKSSDVAESKKETENAVQNLESSKEKNNSSSFSFRNLFYAAIPVSLLGLIIWHFWRNTAK